MIRILFIFTVTTALAFQAAASEWSQFRGPNHDGTSSEKILTAWPASGLREVWKEPMKDGFSAITLGGGKAFTLEARDIDGAAQEVCVALDAKTGRELWAVPLGIAKYADGGGWGTENNKGGDGPRSTPTYDGGKVYTYSSRMILKCLDAASGRQIWACDMNREHAGRNIAWDSAASPLIDGDLVFVAGGGPGEALLAFDKQDGHVVWKGQDDKMTHSTPVAVTLLGVRQVIFLTQSGLVSIVPTTGAPLWRFPFRFHVSTAISPLVCGDIVYCSAAYDVGTSACKINKSADGFVAEQIWHQPANILANHWSTPVYSDGYIYGISGQAKFGKAPLVCVEAATGKVLWSKEGFGPGGCTLVDGCLLVLSDAGDLVLIKAAPESYQEIARNHILSGKCWNAVSVSNGKIYARSTKEGASLDVSVR
jgi:outer membrane protein assembly factor BamB